MKSYNIWSFVSSFYHLAVFSRFIHVVARVSASSLFMAESCSIVWLYYILFIILLSVETIWMFSTCWLLCSYEHSFFISTFIFKSFWYNSASETAGSYSNSMFNLFEKLPNLQQVLSCLAQALPSQGVLPLTSLAPWKYSLFCPHHHLPTLPGLCLPSLCCRLKLAGWVLLYRATGGSTLCGHVGITQQRGPYITTFPPKGVGLFWTNA